MSEITVNTRIYASDHKWLKENRGSGGIADIMKKVISFWKEHQNDQRR